MSNNSPVSFDFDSFKECLECPVCFRLPLTFPIPQCHNGHILCKFCRTKVRCCPVCRAELGQAVSLVAENILGR